ncbi:unnamed protein product [Rotaria sp. Silwood2]|nr:unnamed protein product [Rotaria sp. Silwood2]
MSKSNSSSGSYYQSSQHLSSHSHRSSNAKHYPTFHVHSSDYELVFINNNASTNTMEKLLNHVNTCRQYAIDTESERTNNQLSLIQINSIPTKPPSRVMLFELKHLPDQHSQKYEKILQLFQLIFRLDNEIYSWGKMEKELEPAKELFTWPIPAELIDIQPHFSGWYNWARTQCGVQSLLHRNDENNDNELTQQHHQQSSCYCHSPSPYKINELWSLQNSLKYGCKLFLDKSCTLSHWSSSLTSSHSSLSHADQKKMIHYATHDVMAVTFLIRPITEQWTFEKIKNRKISEMFVAFKSVKLPPLPTTTSTKKKIKNINVQKLSKILTSIDSDIESISSDDEIYLNQLIEPVTNDYHLEVQVKNNDANDDVELQNEVPTTDVIMDDIIDDEVKSVNSHTVVVNEVGNPPEHQQQRDRKTRSFEAKHKKNRKRNLQLRLTRFKYYFTRPYYYKFKSKIIRKVLRHYGVQFRHIKFSYDQVVVGVKNYKARREYEEIVPYSCFNKKNYEVFRR